MSHTPTPLRMQPSCVCNPRTVGTSMLDRILIIMATGLLCLVSFASPAAANCPSPQVTCGGECVDTFRDEENCGGCGIKCARAEECDRGSCELVCPDVQLACGDICVTPAYNPLHCGRCGKRCDDDQYCKRGSCESLKIEAPAGGCPAMQEMCDGRCRDTNVDPSHCGSCGKRCPSGHLCERGQCQPVSCIDMKTPDGKRPTNQSNRKLIKQCRAICAEMRKPTKKKPTKRQRQLMQRCRPVCPEVQKPSRKKPSKDTRSRRTRSRRSR